MRSGSSTSCCVAAALLIVGILLCLQATLMAQESRTMSKALAQTPPMGWNSWDYVIPFFSQNLCFHAACR